MQADLITPCGRSPVDLLVNPARAAELRALAHDAPSWVLTPRQLCDFELLANGAFSPLTGFLTRGDYDGVCENLRLADRTLWPMPITLDITDETADGLTPGSLLFLRDHEGTLLGALHVEDLWRPDRSREASLVYGTTRPEHPGVAHLLRRSHPFYVGGRVEALRLPCHYDFVPLRLGPRELRERFARLGWLRVVAFQTRNPLHRAHVELTIRAARQAKANLLIHPVVGPTRPGDVDHYTRVRCCLAVLPHYPPDTAIVSLLPLAMRMAGPREALLHAIVRRNYGCSHLIMGRDHAGPGADSAGKPFYPPYAAQELVRTHERELGIAIVPFHTMVYVEDKREYMPEDEVPPCANAKTLSGTELRERLARGLDIPDWFSFPEVIAELRRTHPPRPRQGFTVFFTGLPSSGKSTIANVLRVRLLEIGSRPVTLLDGDVVRLHLSAELGFSRRDRDTNIRRIGFVAAEITRSGGAAICAPIAPYDHTRREVRDMVQPLGGFLLVHVSTPIGICEQRDQKGLYARARAGLVPNFTGVSDPYEPPTDADLVINAADLTPEAAADQILRLLREQGYLPAP